MKMFKLRKKDKGPYKVIQVSKDPGQGATNAYYTIIAKFDKYNQAQGFVDYIKPIFETPIWKLAIVSDPYDFFQNKEMQKPIENLIDIFSAK